MKVAMVRVRQRLAAIKSRAFLVLQVHDEVILEVPKAEVDRVMAGEEHGAKKTGSSVLHSNVLHDQCLAAV